MNRVDEVIVFHALDQAQIRAIADVQIERLRQRLSDRRITLHLTPAALDELARIGYDPVYGARPLKRAMRDAIETPLASEILSGAIKDGDVVSVEPGATAGAPFRFEVEPAPVPN